MNVCHLLLPLLLSLVLLLAAPARAQSPTATLSGTVVDESGAVVPGVELTALNRGTRTQRTATTDERGLFAMPLLLPGAYRVTAKRDGFTPLDVPEVVLNVNDQIALRLVLKVGKVGEEVAVVAEPSRVRTSPAVGTVIDRRFVENLPLNGRSFQSLILLTPGVVVTPATDESPGQFSVNGQRANANYFTVDGVSANIGIALADTQHAGGAFSQQLAGTVPGLTASGGTNNLVSIDALEEYAIQTATYTAEFGRQPGGQVSLVTRSGTNQWRGSAHEYFRHEAFDANDWFNNYDGIPEAPRRQHMFGGTLGGPAVLPGLYDGRDRTFFFASYEGQRLRLPFTGETHVPSLRLRTDAPPGLQPFLNAFPRPTGPETVDATGGPSGWAPLRFSTSNPEEMDATSVRLDQVITSSLRLFGRYNQAPSGRGRRNPYNLAWLEDVKGTTRTLTMGATQSLTSRLQHELRVNFSDNRGQAVHALDDYGGAVPIELDRAALPRGFDGPVTVSMLVDSGGGSYRSWLMLGDGVDSRQRQFNVVDILTWTTGSHLWKFGVDYRRMTPIYGPWAYQQSASFVGQQAVLAGLANAISFGASQGARPIFDNVSVFAQDSWRLSRRGTLDLGLRWEVNPAPREATGKVPALVVLGDADDLATARLVQDDASFYATSWTSFAPRIGGAFVLRDAPGRETVLRGGASLAYDLGSGQAAQAFNAGGAPFLVRRDERNAPYPVPPDLAAPPPFAPLTLPTTQSLRALNPELAPPYTWQFSAAVEQALGALQTVTLTYVGSAARRLLVSEWLNRPDDLAAEGARSNPDLGDVIWSTSGATSDYHSLQAQYQRRLSRGVQALVNYTWSHAIDEVSDEGTTELLRGNAAFDVRHNFSAAVTADLPVWRAGALAPLFRGWSVDVIAHAQSGSPVDLYGGTMLGPGGRSVVVRPDVVPSVPFYLDDPTVPGGRRFNAAAFQPVPRDPATGVALRPGTFGRNVLRGLPLYQVDLALRRQIPLGTRARLELRAEAFNVLNHPNFGGYGTSAEYQPEKLGVPGSMLNGRLGGLSALYQIGGPRSLQFSLKLRF